MAELQRRLDRLEAIIKPPENDDLVIFYVITPAGVNGGPCPESAARGVQSGRCGDRTFQRELNETEKAFRIRVFDAVKIPGGVAVAMLE